MITVTSLEMKKPPLSQVSVHIILCLISVRNRLLHIGKKTPIQ